MRGDSSRVAKHPAGNEFTVEVGRQRSYVAKREARSALITSSLEPVKIALVANTKTYSPLSASTGIRIRLSRSSEAMIHRRPVWLHGLPGSEEVTGQFVDPLHFIF